MQFLAKCIYYQIFDPLQPFHGRGRDCFCIGDISKITDVIAWNQYFGWYGDNMDDMGRWIDREHAAHPERKMGISEYGAGACKKAGRRSHDS